MTTATLPGLRGLTDTELAALADADESAWPAVAAEAARRDRADRARSQRRGHRRIADTAWMDAAHADYLAASEACCGHLLSAHGAATVQDEMSLWSGPEHVARARASEELNAWWDQHGRLTVSEWRRAMNADAAAEEIAALLVEELEGEPGFVAVTDPSPAPETSGDDGIMGIPDCGEDEPQETLMLAKRPYLPLGDVVLMYGPGGKGKGRICMSVIADVTNGKPVGLDTVNLDGPADVIVVLPEDKHTEQVIPRLIAAGADRKRVHNLTRLPDGSRFKLSASAKTPGHLPVLAAFIEALRRKGRNPRLVIIDPVAAAVGEGTIQTNKGARQMIEPLQDTADDLGVTVIMVAHPTKAGSLQGSAGLEQAARVIYYVDEDELNSAHRVMKLVKGNNVPPSLAGELRFAIEEDGSGQPRAVWLDRVAISERKQAWRDDLATRRQQRAAAGTAPAGEGGPAGTFAARFVVFTGGRRVAENLPGPFTTLAGAQQACDERAGIPLRWRPMGAGWAGSGTADGHPVAAVIAAARLVSA